MSETVSADSRDKRGAGVMAILRSVFLRLGVLPFFLVIAIVTFSLLSDRFLAVGNFMNVFRQSVYLLLVSMGQMLALLTGGFDLS